MKTNYWINQKKIKTLWTQEIEKGFERVRDAEAWGSQFHPDDKSGKEFRTYFYVSKQDNDDHEKAIEGMRLATTEEWTAVTNQPNELKYQPCGGSCQKLRTAFRICKTGTCKLPKGHEGPHEC